MTAANRAQREGTAHEKAHGSHGSNGRAGVHRGRSVCELVAEGDQRGAGSGREADGALPARAALARSCPKVIKEGREAAAKTKADDPKAKAAVAKLDEPQKLHDGGKHAESLKLANEATADLKK